VSRQNKQRRNAVVKLQVTKNHLTGGKMSNGLPENRIKRRNIERFAVPTNIGGPINPKALIR